MKALTRFHYREINRCRVELQREKRLKAKNSSRIAKNVKQKSKKAVLSAPSTSNVNVTIVTKLAENIKEKMTKFNEVMSQLQEMTNKQVKQYKCLFSEDVTETGMGNGEWGMRNSGQR